MAKANVPEPLVGWREPQGRVAVLFRKLLPQLSPIGHDTIHGLENLLLCAVCGGHDLVLHGDVVQCHDCGFVAATIKPAVIEMAA